MRMTGEGHSVSIGVLHGYMLGVNGTTKYTYEDLFIITDKFVDNCLDNPNDKTLDIFRKSCKVENEVRKSRSDYNVYPENSTP